MIVKNTSVYPTPALRVLMDFVLRAEKHRPRAYIQSVNITNCSHAYRGRCIGKRILVRIGPPDLFSTPISPKYRKRAPSYTIHDWKECFVVLFAHEVEHAAHFHYGHGVDEVGCEFAGKRALEAFRKERETLDRDITEAVEKERLAAEERDRRKKEKRSPEAKVAKIETDIARWERKLKTAQTYLKKYRTKLARARRTSGEPLLAAAKKEI
jgi:hypothetical protein